jgi:hypothetical protein
MKGVVGNNCGIVKFARETVDRELGETVAMKGSIGEKLSLRRETADVNCYRYATANTKSNDLHRRYLLNKSAGRWYFRPAVPKAGFLFLLGLWRAACLTLRSLR